MTTVLNIDCQLYVTLSTSHYPVVERNSDYDKCYLVRHLGLHMWESGI